MTDHHNAPGRQSRRSFLKHAAVAGATLAGAGPGLITACAQTREETVAIVPNPGDPLTSQPPVQWAIEQLRQALESRGLMARVRNNLDEAAADDECILVASSLSPLVRQGMQHLTVKPVFKPGTVSPLVLE